MHCMLKDKFNLTNEQKHLKHFSYRIYLGNMFYYLRLRFKLEFKNESIKYK